MDEKQFENIILYTLKLIDQTISPEEFDELNTVVSSDKQAARYYNQLMMTVCNFQEIGQELILDKSITTYAVQKELWESLAEYEKTAPEIKIQEKMPLQESIQKIIYDKTPRRISKFSLFTITASAVAVLLIVLGNWLLPIKVSRPVASITSSIDAVWSSSNDVYKAGTRLWNDGSLYQLNQGLAEVTFDNGAKVLLESPSQFKVLSENEMFLQGKLVAEVPASACGFTVDTSNSKVVDLGTQFGLFSSVENGTEVHVRKGQVQMTGTASDNTGILMQLINAGQGGQISSSGALSRIEYDKDKFYWDMPSPYVYAIKKSKPLYYWRFDWDQDRIMRDEMAPQVKPQNCLIGRFDFDDGPPIGSDRPNQALYFSGRKDNYIVLYDNPEDYTGANGLSLSMWIRPEVSKAQDIVVHRKKDSSTMHTDEITITEDNRVKFYVFCPPDSPEPWTYEVKSQGYNMVQSNPIPLNQWTHIAVTYTYGDRMNLYINGQLEASRKLSGAAQRYPDIDCWYIGSEWQDFSKEIVDKPRCYRGSIDEISRYNRELSAEDVWMFYKSATRSQ